MDSERGKVMTVRNGINAIAPRDPQGMVDTAKERTRYRRSVLHLGALFGWSQEEIVLFAEAVGTRRWEELDVRDLLAVIQEYRSLLQVLAAKLGRQRYRTAVAPHQAEADDGCGD